jgi:MarR family transcriptional regulator, transcriptional regulator for hemolysin
MYKPYEKLGLLMGDTSRTWRIKMNEKLAPLGLTHAKWSVLMQLARSDGELTQKALAHRLGIEGPTLVRLLDQLEQEGWVERRPGNDDRRTKTVAFAEAAGSKFRQAQLMAQEMREAVFAGFADDELDRFIEMLERIKERVGEL